MRLSECCCWLNFTCWNLNCWADCNLFGSSIWTQKPTFENPRSATHRQIQHRSALECLFEIQSASHFGSCRRINHRWHHLRKAFKFSCRNKQSVFEIIWWYKVRSSAKTLNLQLTNCDKSLRYKMNKNGPRIVPCGTPEITGSKDEKEPFKTTRCLRVVKKHRN